ncbi:MAG: hypothetical protein LQ343_007964 [Gyalolechia ehrenbergii]|nr:MAG: hypothetical protein LQ343_007964 [Gyalolechia ehrenbergii]
MPLNKKANKLWQVVVLLITLQSSAQTIASNVPLFHYQPRVRNKASEVELFRQTSTRGFLQAEPSKGNGYIFEDRRPVSARCTGWDGWDYADSFRPMSSLLDASLDVPVPAQQSTSAQLGRFKASERSVAEKEGIIQDACKSCWQLYHKYEHERKIRGALQEKVAVLSAGSESQRKEIDVLKKHVGIARSDLDWSGTDLPEESNNVKFPPEAAEAITEVVVENPRL